MSNTVDSKYQIQNVTIFDIARVYVQEILTKQEVLRPLDQSIILHRYVTVTMTFRQ